MEIEYIAFDSFGIKSSCIRVVSEGISIVVDPGIATETDSFPLPFAERVLLKQKYFLKIKKACKKSDVVIITHYHWDHVVPKASLYKNKILLIKDPKMNINKSQRERAQGFLKMVKPVAKEIKIADNREFKFGETKINFSKPLWHGRIGTKLGKVLMVTIIDKEKRVVFTSDIDGPYIPKYTDLIIKEKPDILIIDAFPSYLLGFIASFENLKRAIKNTIKILENTNASLYLIEHHLLRDYRYKEVYYEVYKKARELGKNVMTAAELAGKKPAVLAGYKKYGPTRWKTWKRFSFEEMNKKIKHAKKVARDRY